jgi:sugar/nucleoside kinase (ribokinase family)
MTWDVAGIGNALMDALVIVEDDSVLSDLQLDKGTMHLVDHDKWMAAYERIRRHRVAFETGGSCANTVATVGLLGGRAVYCGQVGNDQMGHLYASKMTETCGEHGLCFSTDRATGKCLSIISATDAERTMLTDLGAAVELPGLGAFESKLSQAKIGHFEGYTLFGGPTRDATFEALRCAKANGVKISFDASDPSVVHAVKPMLWEVLREFVDVAFLNAEETRALSDGLSPEQAIDLIAREAGLKTTVVKLGSRGSLIRHEGKDYEVGIRKVHAVDTTGAGDAYAGGYLYGLANGWDPESCGQLAAAVAALTVSQVGAVARDRDALTAIRDEIAAARG